MKKTKKKEFSKATQKLDKEICSQYLNKILDSKVFDCNINNNRGLVQLFTGNKAEGTIYYDLMNFYNIGISSMDTFIKSRILKESSVTVPVRKHVLKTFTLPIHKQKTKKVNCEHKEKMLYNRCIKKEMAFSMRSGKPLQNFRQYISLPRAICNVDGSINHQDTKSNATRHLNSRYDNIIIEKMPSGSNSDLVILEGMFIINSAPIRSRHKTFSDHMQYLIRRWILPHFKSGAKEVHILFDRPGALSQDGSPTLKDLERCRRDDKKKPADTVENIVISSQLPKGKWIDFIMNRENKKHYINLISQNFLNFVRPQLKKEQTCVLNGCFEGGNCYAISDSSDDCFPVENLASNHEETDTLIWLHVMKSCHNNILIFSPDTDILFIGLSFASKILLSGKKIMLQINVLGETVKYVDFNKLTDSFSPRP